MNDLRLIELEKRDSMSLGVREIVGTLVTGSILVMVGLYTYSKVGGSIDQSSFTAAENTTMSSIKSNVLSGFDLSSVVFIVLAAAGIIGIIWLAFR